MISNTSSNFEIISFTSSEVFDFSASESNEGEYDLETGITISGKSETLGELTVTFWRSDNENFNTQIEDVT